MGVGGGGGAGFDSFWSGQSGAGVISATKLIKASISHDSINVRFHFSFLLLFPQSVCVCRFFLMRGHRGQSIRSSRYRISLVCYIVPCLYFYLIFRVLRFFWLSLLLWLADGPLAHAAIFIRFAQTVPHVISNKVAIRRETVVNYRVDLPLFFPPAFFFIEDASSIRLDHPWWFHSVLSRCRLQKVES